MILRYFLNVWRDRLRRRAAVAFIVGVGALAWHAPLRAEPVVARDDFTPQVRMAPFVVSGQQLTVSIHARSGRDRRYAEAFATEVVKVVYEGVTEKTGKGLVIIGRKAEPHPIQVFRSFLTLAAEGKLDPAIAARGAELDSMLHRWEHVVDAEPGRKEGGEVDLAFDRIVTALPLRLDGIGAKLYQLAWAEGFDPVKVEARLRGLRVADLDHDLFARFDWTFYLPPRDAFDRVLDQLIADELKEENAGFMARAAVKTVMLAVKPKIRRAIEALRQGLLFQAIVETRTRLPEDDVSALMSAYVEVLMPDDDTPAKGDAHAVAVRAVRERRVALEAKAKAEAEADAEKPSPVEGASTPTPAAADAKPSA